MTAPLMLEDVVLAELVWAASKSFLAGLAILLVVWSLGLSESWLSLWVLAVIPLIGLCFAGLALTMTALAPSYDFFMYYFTLFITPMMLLCGVFFPADQLPQILQQAAAFLPLTHAVALVRPLMNDAVPPDLLAHLGVLVLYAIVGFYAALAFTRRRLLK